MFYIKTDIYFTPFVKGRKKIQKNDGMKQQQEKGKGEKKQMNKMECN